QDIYAFSLNNPMRFLDPDGHDAAGDDDEDEAADETRDEEPTPPDIPPPIHQSERELSYYKPAKEPSWSDQIKRFFGVNDQPSPWLCAMGLNCLLPPMHPADPNQEYLVASRKTPAATRYGQEAAKLLGVVTTIAALAVAGPAGTVVPELEP